MRPSTTCTCSLTSNVLSNALLPGLYVAQTIENAVCLHEEDYGMLWKHVDWRTGCNASRRSRRLVVSFVCTVANYEVLRSMSAGALYAFTL